MENLGNIITLLTLLLTIILGISDINRRRAEADKMKTEGKLNTSSADTKIMTEIKQASIDLVNSLREDVDTLEETILTLRKEVSYYKRLLRDNNILFTNFDSRPLPAIDMKAIEKKERENKDSTGQL